MASKLHSKLNFSKLKKNFLIALINIKKVLKNKNHSFFFATNDSELLFFDQLEELKEELKNKSNYSAPFI